MSTKFFTSFFATAFLIFVSSVGVFADTIRLKDGSIIKGRIVAFGGGSFTVVIGEGSRERRMTFTAAEVDSIQFESPTNSISEPRQIPVRSSGTSVSATPENKPAQRVVVTDNIGKAAPSGPRPAATPAASTPANDEPSVIEENTEPLISEPAGKRSGSAPVVVNVKVLADSTNNGWTNSGWVVKKGQTIRISAEGEVSLGGGRTSGPSGKYEIEDAEKLMKAVPTGALIAVIGDDNNDFVYVGSDRIFTAPRDGALFLGVNEGNLDDNSGSFTVKLEIEPK